MWVARRQFHLRCHLWEGRWEEGSWVAEQSEIGRLERTEWENREWGGDTLYFSYAGFATVSTSN